MKKKLKITPDAPKNECGLVQMITMRKSIRQKWVKLEAENMRFLYGIMIGVE